MTEEDEVDEQATAMQEIRANICSLLDRMEQALAAAAGELHDKAVIWDYRELVYEDGQGNAIWSEAFQKALEEHEILVIPGREAPYYLDRSIQIPSNRYILAQDGAVIRLTEGVRVLMFRNANTEDGTKKPVLRGRENHNITICGGRWEESCRCRAGYGKSGMYDEDRSFYGVSTCMFFNNMEGLTLRNMTFAHTGGFAVQCGDLKNALFENICFEECYADGLHINGNTENVIARNIRGQVGDDLVALNMYDWQNSSINFGPIKNVLCEALTLAEDGRYKAMRILPAVYYYEDGLSVDCSIQNLIVRKVKGIKTFKLYFQTPRYLIGEAPEPGAVGSGENLFFEDIEIALDAPIDKLPVYMNSDAQKGSFAGFELGANLKNISFRNINLCVDRDRWPMAFFMCVGPKSCEAGGYEIFDPYISCTVENVYTENVMINGEVCDDLEAYIHEIDFGDQGGAGRIVR